MRVAIDQDKCNGAGICVQELPELFRFQEGSKKGIPLAPEVPAHLEAKLREVAPKCPTGALLLLEG
jgi:ferredoxin